MLPRTVHDVTQQLADSGLCCAKWPASTSPGLKVKPGTWYCIQLTPDDIIYGVSFPLVWSSLLRHHRGFPHDPVVGMLSGPLDVKGHRDRLRVASITAAGHRRVVPAEDQGGRSL